MTPALTILTINAVFVVFAYGLAYPLLRVRTIGALALYDAIICSVAVGLAGVLFWGSGTAFSLVLFDTNWFVFSLLTLMLIEALPAMAYLKRHNINLADPDQD